MYNIQGSYYYHRSTLIRIRGGVDADFMILNSLKTLSFVAMILFLHPKGQFFKNAIKSLKYFDCTKDPNLRTIRFKTALIKEET